MPPRRSPLDSCRRYAIRGTALTVQAERDRIWAQHLLEGRVARRQAAPTYDRNRRLFRDHLNGASETELGRTYGMRAHRVREIIRMETAWAKLRGPEGDAVPAVPRERLKSWSPRTVPDLARTAPQTASLLP